MRGFISNQNSEQRIITYTVFSVILFVLTMIGLGFLYSYYLHKPIEAPSLDFVNMNLLEKPVFVDNTPFYEASINIDVNGDTQKCCNFPLKKLNIKKHRGKYIVLFFNLMGYGQKMGSISSNPEGNSSVNTAEYLKRLKLILKALPYKTELWFVRAAAMLPGERIVTRSFQRSCKFKDFEITSADNVKCYDKFLIFGKGKKGYFKGGNASLKYWISKNCPGDNIASLNRPTTEAHSWPITCLIDPKGYSRLENSTDGNPQILYNKILKIANNANYLTEPLPDLNLVNRKYPDFIGWIMETVK